MKPDNLDELTARLDHLEANRDNATFVNLRKPSLLHLMYKNGWWNKSFWDLFSILVQMESKKETGTQRALAIKAANQSNADVLVLDLASSMSYKRPYTIFEESLTKLDALAKMQGS